MRIIIILILLSTTSCTRNHIKAGDSLCQETKQLISDLGILPENEKIIKYYSNFRESNAGSFYTDRRIAHYWIDESHPERNDTSFALYTDIVRIDTVFHAGATHSPFLKARLTDSSQIFIYADGAYTEIKAFFEEIIGRWKAQTQD